MHDVGIVINSEITVAGRGPKSLPNLREAESATMKSRIFKRAVLFMTIYA